MHLHIPKNAGTSFSRMLKMGMLVRPPTNLLRQRVTLGLYDVPGLENRLDAIVRLAPRDASRVRFFEAHCGWGVHERLPGECLYMTLLREPVRRALSVHAFLQQDGVIPVGTPLEEFLRTEPADRVWSVDNAQVRYLAGEGGMNDTRPIGSCTRAMLETAKERLRSMFMFGLVERYDESCAMLRGALGWRGGFSITSNVTTKAKKIETTPAQDALLREMNALDIELYDYAMALFAERVEGGGPALARDAARFGARSARMARLAGATIDRALTARRKRREGERA